MLPGNPLRDIPTRFRLLAYSLLGLLVFLLLLLCQWLLVERQDFGELPDFAAIENVDEMKEAFYTYLKPVARHHNNTIREHRARLKALQRQQGEGRPLSSADQGWLRKLSAQYELEWEGGEPPDGLLQRLLLRVDTIPLPLALVQAAKESGWGRSRFAVEANNLFGQWCYSEGCGIVPANRSAAASHEVEVFGSVSEAMRRYMNNLNTHESYQDFRRLRAQRRENEQPLTGIALAAALIYYSERREDYVDDIRAMIRQFLRLQAQESTS